MRLRDERRSVEEQEARVADLDAARERRADELSEAAKPFSPDALLALERVRTSLVEAACSAGRSSARAGEAAPTGAQVVSNVVAGIEDPVLSRVEGWPGLLADDAADVEVRRCYDAEALLIQDEARRAEEEARAAEEEERRRAADQEAEDRFSTTTPPTPPAADAPSSGCEEFLREVDSDGRPATSGETQYLWIECGIDYRD